MAVRSPCSTVDVTTTAASAIGMPSVDFAVPVKVPVCTPCAIARVGTRARNVNKLSTVRFIRVTFRKSNAPKCTEIVQITAQQMPWVLSNRILLTSLGLSDSRDDTMASRLVPKRHKSDDSANESELLIGSMRFGAYRLELTGSCRTGALYRSRVHAGLE